jgi:hypothetical protein
MAETFADLMQRERDRLNAEREAVRVQQRELQGRLDAINKEFAAVDAYERAKSGKAAPSTRRAGAPRAARRGSRREELLQLIRSEPDGLKRGDILERMGLKQDKAGSMSVSNALTALTKSNQVQRRDGKYHLSA